MKSLFFILFFAILAKSRSVAAWWDEGHMLIGAIAKLQLTEKEVKKIEGTLFQWNGVYADLSTIPVASVWADHIKCLKAADYCEGLNHLERFVAFNDMHYISRKYAFGNHTISGIYEYFPLPNSGAVWFLDKILSSFGIQEIHSENETNQQLYGGVHLWNLSLRLLIHIIGDIHQPLHNILCLSDTMPKGDAGGTDVKIKYEQENANIQNLHQFWDAAGGLYTLSWPHINEEDAMKEAKNLMNLYPKNLFDESNGLLKDKIDFNLISQHAFDYAADVYSIDDIDPKNINYSTTNFVPSEEYIRKAREICQKQLTLGGYNLAIVLKKVVNYLPEFESSCVCTAVPPPISGKNYSYDATIYLLCVFAISACICLSVFALWKKFSYRTRNGNSSSGVGRRLLDFENS